MRRKHLFKITPLCIALASMHSLCSAAPVVQVTVGVESSRFVDGLDITGGKPAINLAADVSFENGSFGGADCYKTQTLFFQDGIDAGCNYYVGYFSPRKNDQALSATLSRSEYAPTPALQWDSTTAALSWHTNRSTTLTLSAVDDWFGRGFSSVGVNAAYQHSLSDHWSANGELSYINFSGSAPINAINYARLGLRFEKGRWTSELNLQLSDNSLRQITSIDVDQPALSLRISYRLY